MIVFLVYCLLGGSALFIIYHDVKEQIIPLSGLLLFMGAAFLKQAWEPEGEGLWAAGAIILIFFGCQSLFYFYKRQFAMGWGDLILGPCCGLWLLIQDLPSFLLSTGIVALFMGIFWRWRWGMHTFPFAPAILLGLGVVFLMRCFAIGNGI